MDRFLASHCLFSFFDLFRFFELFIRVGIRLVGLGIGRILRLLFGLDGRCRDHSRLQAISARLPTVRLQERHWLVYRAAFRASDRLAPHVIEGSLALQTHSLLAPTRFSHRSAPEDRCGAGPLQSRASSPATRRGPAPFADRDGPAARPAVSRVPNARIDSWAYAPSHLQ